MYKPKPPFLSPQLSRIRSLFFSTSSPSPRATRPGSNPRETAWRNRPTVPAVPTVPRGAARASSPLCCGKDKYLLAFRFADYHSTMHWLRSEERKAWASKGEVSALVAQLCWGRGSLLSLRSGIYFYVSHITPPNQSSFALLRALAVTVY